MKQKVRNRVIAYFLSSVMFVGIFSVFGSQVHAEDGTSPETEVIINPMYADILDESEVRFELIALQGQTDSGIALLSEPVICETAEEAAACLREQMVLRNTSITLVVNEKIFSGGVTLSQILDSAMEYSEDCRGQEGDALAFGWKGVSMGASYYASGYRKVNYSIAYHTDAKQELALTEAVESALENMNMDGLLEYEKAKIIHDYICTNVNYDYTYTKYSAYEALCDGTAVCQGYAVLFYRLCKEAGLSVRIISGIGNGGTHAWNIVQIGGRYYNIDCTWDGQSDINYDTYFLKSDKDFNDHIRADEYLTGEFATVYSMAELSWKDYSLLENKLLKSNYNVTFTALDGSTVTSTANGKAKILVFYNLNCLNSQKTLKSISGGEFSDVDIIAIEVKQNSKTDIETFRDTYASNHIIYTYCESASSDEDAMWAYVRLIEGKYSLTYPYIVYIDGNNQIQYATTGYSGAGTIEDNIEYYFTDYVLPAETTFDKSSIQLEVEEKGKVTATVSPANATLKTVGYESADKNVARVDSNGNIVAIAKGKTTITAYAVDAFSTTQSTCEVSVTGKSVKEITLYNTSMILKTGSTGQLVATVSPVDAENKEVAWCSSDTSVAAVDENGRITAVGKGSAIITVTAQDGSGLTAGCEITVIQPVTGIALNKTSLVLDVLDTDTLTVAVMPEDADNKEVKWSSSDTSIASVDENGKVTAMGEGTVTITVTATDGSGISAECVVTSQNPFSDVTIDSWYYGPVEYANNSGFMTGVGLDENGKVKFKPLDDITREQFVTALWKKEKIGEIVYTARFTDVPFGEYYTSAVMWASENSIVNGVSAATYGVGQKITREQIATMLYRYANYKGYNTSGRAELSAYKDATLVDSWALDAILWAVDKGIIGGKPDASGMVNLLDPDGNATRAECATMMQRFVNAYEK